MIQITNQFSCVISNTDAAEQKNNIKSEKHESNEQGMY